LGAGEEPLTGLSGRRIYSCANIGQQLRGILNLIEYNRQLEFVEESAGIGPHTRQDVGILKQPVVRAGEHMPEKRRFSNPPGSGKDDRGEISARLEEGSF
jgi:hypothetical protein